MFAMHNLMRKPAGSRALPSDIVSSAVTGERFRDL